MISTLKKYTQRVSKDLNKKVELNVDQFSFDKIPGQFKILTKDILIQLIRNSITHGIETPIERKEKGKDEIGSMVITNNFNDNLYSFTVYDDGNGLQLDKLKQKMKNHEDCLLFVFDIERVIETPTINKKKGKMRSVGVHPCQLACKSGE